MEEIKVGDKVRILANDNVWGSQYEPSSSKHLDPLEDEHLKDKLGIVIPKPVRLFPKGMSAIKDYEVFVKLDNGWTVIISKSHLTPVPPLNQ